MRMDDFRELKVYTPTDLPRWDWLDFDMVKKLDTLTVKLGRTTPLQILSLFRTEEENEAAGGAAKSMHLLGKATDFVPPGDPLTAYNMAQEVGFTGIGLYVNERGVTSIHVDNRPGRSARWGVLEGVYGAITPVIDRLKALGYRAVQEPAVKVGGIVLTIVIAWYIFTRR